MMRVLKIIFALTMAVFVAACTGSGTSGRATILAEVEKAEPNSIYVYRDTGFAGSGALMEVLINNQKAGTIGIKESLKTTASKGQNTLTVRYTGLASFNTPGTLTFESNGTTPNFFVVTQKQSLMGAKIQVAETTAGSFANLLE